MKKRTVAAIVAGVVILVVVIPAMALAIFFSPHRPAVTEVERDAERLVEEIEEAEREWAEQRECLEDWYCELDEE